QTRASLTPVDIGADAGDFYDPLLTDLIGPEISYTPLANSSCTSPGPTLPAVITDISGVNILAGTRPRLYYKKTTNVNNYLGNTNATDGWKYVEATGTGNSPFSFVIDYSLINGGVAVGNTIQYFVTAQDLVVPANVSINSGIYAPAFMPASVALTASAFPVHDPVNTYTVSMPGLATNVNIGAAGTYPSLTGAGGLFAAINAAGLSANITATIIDAALPETGAVALNQMSYGCSGPFSLTIVPASAGTVISGTLASDALIRIKSSNVIIDGSSNATSSRDLTISNTSVTSPAVLLIGSTGTVPVTNTTIKNCIVIDGSVALTTAVYVSDGTIPGAAGYFNNITIQNNDVQQAYTGIFASAAVTTGNGSGLNIVGNSINAAGVAAIGNTGIYVQGVDGANVSNNDIGNFESVTNQVDAGIWFDAGTSNSIIEKNKIHDIHYTGIAGYAAKGIFISTGLAAANIEVSNNMIYGISGDGDDYATYGSLRSPVGIYGNGTQGGINMYYNSIYLSGSTINLPGVYSIGIALDDGSNAVIKDNIVKNELGLLGGIGVGAVGIAAQTSAAQFTSLDYNDYFSAAALGTSLIGKIAATDYVTLAAWQTATGQEANSLNIQPNFVSATDLHLVVTNNCGLDGYGVPVAGITADYDNDTRDITTPDMGADEFTAIYSGTLAGIAATAVCENKTVSLSGTTYATGVCDLIARVLPSGGSAVGGKINACVTLDATQQYFNGEPYVQRHYDIEPAVNPVTATATITLYFTDQEFIDYNTNNPVWPDLPTAVLGNADPNRANVRVTQFHGMPTGGLPTSTPGNYSGARILINPGAANVLWNGSYWAVTFNVTGFSGFYLHTTLHETPLPISINYFTGVKRGSNHLLNWKVTCNTTPGVTMILERSGNSRNFNAINSVTADAVRCNQPFDYTDTDPLPGMNYYRLKIVDADGKVTYSTTVALLNASKGFDIISIAPNPVVTGNFTLNMASAQASKIDISIFDMQGRLVNRQTISVIAGFNSISMQAGNLGGGTYTIQANVADERSKMIRFVKQ
ncbi:MAG: T9SS type A sorting domain-containing protein, partial [Ferruginibacter sp.]